MKINTFGDILILIGSIIIFSSMLLAWMKAMHDEDMDKSDILWGTYILLYPRHGISVLVGIVVAFIGWLLNN